MVRTLACPIFRMRSRLSASTACCPSGDNLQIVHHHDGRSLSPRPSFFQITLDRHRSLVHEAGLIVLHVLQGIRLANHLDMGASTQTLKVHGAEQVDGSSPEQGLLSNRTPRTKLIHSSEASAASVHHSFEDAIALQLPRTRT